MRKVAISEFKARCLLLIDDVNATGEPLSISRRGKTVAILHPVPRTETDWTPGAFRDCGRIKGDIIGGLDVDWDVLK